MGIRTRGIVKYAVRLAAIRLIMKRSIPTIKGNGVLSRKALPQSQELGGTWRNKSYRNLTQNKWHRERLLVKANK